MEDTDLSLNTYEAFQTLGLSQGADAEAVKAAYHRQVKRCHPDQFHDKDRQEAAQAELVQLNLAYQQALKAVQVNRCQTPPHLTPEQAKASARHFYRIGEYDSALRQLIRTDLHDAEYHYLRGQILTGLRQYGNAHQAFREAALQEPANREYHRAAFNAAITYKKHRQLPYRLADWAGDILRPHRRTRSGKR